MVRKTRVIENITNARIEKYELKSNLCCFPLLDDTLTVMSKSFEITQRLFTDFLGHASQRGWNTKIVQLGADEWRANWSVYGISEKKYY